jgi:hypothetical protein
MVRICPYGDYAESDKHFGIEHHLHTCLPIGFPNAGLEQGEAMCGSKNRFGAPLAGASADEAGYPNSNGMLKP